MKFNLFKMISENISKLLSNNKVIDNNNSNTENNYFTEKFEEFLKIEDCLFCYKMIDEGYQPGILSNKKLNKLIWEKIDNNEYSDLDVRKIVNLEYKTRIFSLMKNININTRDYYNNHDLFNYKNKNLAFEDKYILSLFEQTEHKNVFLNYLDESLSELKKYYKSGIDTLGDFYYKTNEQNQKVMQHTNNLIYVTSLCIKNDIFNPEQVQSIKDWFKNISADIEDKTAEKYKLQSFSKIGKEYIDSFIKSVGKFQSERLSIDNNKENILQQLKSAKSRQTTVGEKINHLVINQEYSIENLPIDAREKVKHIEKMVNKINQEEVNEFIKERVPNILKKYFSIDEEYRTTLKSVEGYNAEELMNQSLDNIEKIVKAKIEDNNYDLLSELSVENRKLKVKV